MGKIRAVINLVKWLLYRKKQGMLLQFATNVDYINWFKHYRSGLKKFYNIHEGQDCFIVGNGPSLNKTDLNKLKDYYVFGLNKIHLIFEKYPQFKLSYHVVVNPLVIEQIYNELEQGIYNCHSFLSYSDSKKIKFINPNIHKILTTNQWSFYTDITRPICDGYTVTYAAIQIAYYMGFQNVFLVGVDHNFQQKGKPNEQQEFKGEDINHFHPDYFKGQQWHLADLEGNEASYALAKHDFHIVGREIYDATIDGKLQVFKKISFDDSLKIAKKKPN
ncbi:MAG: DUF115 domain-containing protein [Chitinophagales bacterium]|nr:DUF115 domain-containing protein [Chitinophagales bacterium]